MQWLEHFGRLTFTSNYFARRKPSSTKKQSGLANDVFEIFSRPDHKAASVNWRETLDCPCVAASWTQSHDEISAPVTLSILKSSPRNDFQLETVIVLLALVSSVWEAWMSEVKTLTQVYGNIKAVVSKQTPKQTLVHEVALHSPINGPGSLFVTPVSHSRCSATLGEEGSSFLSRVTEFEEAVWSERGPTECCDLDWLETTWYIFFWMNLISLLQIWQTGFFFLQVHLERADELFPSWIFLINPIWIEFWLVRFGRNLKITHQVFEQSCFTFFFFIKHSSWFTV